MSGGPWPREARLGGKNPSMIGPRPRRECGRGCRRWSRKHREGEHLGRDLNERSISEWGTRGERDFSGLTVDGDEGGLHFPSDLDTVVELVLEKKKNKEEESGKL